jgi:hypothetical protein
MAGVIEFSVVMKRKARFEPSICRCKTFSFQRPRDPWTVNKCVQHEAFLRRPSKSPVSLVGRDSRRLGDISDKTDQNHRTEAVKTDLCAAKTKMTQKTEF